MKLDIEDFKRKLESPEVQKYMSEFVERLAKSQKITEEITKNEDYINWLENFIINDEGFSDDDWLYCPEKISEDDKKNVSKLSNFYDAIQIYADKNFIYGNQDEFGNHYNIMHNNVGYEIGLMTGQGTIFWVKKQELTENNVTDFIDFKLIQENKITDRAEIIAKKLSCLDSFIINMVSENIPIEAIADITEKRLKLLKEKK